MKAILLGWIRFATISAAAIAAWATTGWAIEPAGPDSPAAIAAAREAARDLDDFQRQRQRDDDRVAQARVELQNKWDTYKQHGDRRAYRDWRRSYEDWIDAGRARDADTSRFVRRWQREHPGLPVPTVSGTSPAPGTVPPPGSFPGATAPGTPRTSVFRWPNPWGSPGRQPPSPGATGQGPLGSTSPGSIAIDPGMAEPSVVIPPPPRPSPQQPGDVMPDPGQPQNIIGPELPEPIPSPPSTPVSPGPSSAREL